MSHLSDERPDDAADASGRRGFLSKSGMMLALLALAQGGDSALAAAVDKPNAMTGPVTVAGSESRAVGMFLNTSIRMGKIDTASPEFMKFSPAVQKALASLTPGDVATLSRAQQILTSKIKPVEDNNTGTIGM